MSRPTIIAGNWKMHKTIDEAVQFVKELSGKIGDAGVEVRLAVPFTAIAPAKEAAEGGPILIGAQNMNDASEGAFTGEVAASMLIDAGARFVLIGHSERRHIFGETDQFINKKVHRACSEQLQPILCIGETEQQREAGEAENVVRTQLEQGLAGIAEQQAEGLILAYEPVWAIGTGRTATPQDAQTMHQAARKVLSEMFSEQVAQNTPILYGGSVKGSNAAQILQLPDIDGVLVGGASLSLDSFNEIIHYKKPVNVN